MVAAPDVVVRVVEEFEVRGVRFRVVTGGGDGGVGCAGGIDTDGLVAGNGGGDFREFIPDQCVLRSTPMAGIGDGPGEPGGGLWSPLGGHGVTGFGRSHGREAGFFRAELQRESAALYGEDLNREWLRMSANRILQGLCTLGIWGSAFTGWVARFCSDNSIAFPMLGG